MPMGLIYNNSSRYHISLFIKNIINKENKVDVLENKKFHLELIFLI